MTKSAYIMVAPNGARRVKADHPAIPLDADELGHEAARCLEKGAAAIHLHVRDAGGGHSLEAGRYLGAIAAVRREAKDIVIQITTEAVGIYQPPEQMAMVRAVKPEFVSLAVREIVPDTGKEKDAVAFFTWMRLERVVPQFILYDTSDIDRLEDLQTRGIVPFAAPPVIYVLGRYAEGQISEPEELDPFLEAAGARFPNWMVCAFGPCEAAALGRAFARGGHGRTGFENNLHLPDRTIAPDNAALVEVTANEAAGAGCALMNPTQVRELLAKTFA
jgi:uncharacterized protein (DUF849 family)